MNGSISNKRKSIILVITYILIIGITFSFKPLLSLNNNYVYKISLQVGIYLVLLAVSLGGLFLSKKKLEFIAINNNNFLLQLLFAGIIVVILLSLIIGIPYLFQMDIHDMIGTGSNNIGTQIVLLILVVGPVEEIIFRGYIYHILKEMTNKWVAGVLSSLLFGIWHLVNGNIFQGIITSLIGFVFVLNLILNKKANLWSVVIAHGVYDAVLIILATIL